jgi:glycosyltransferase involved in cell wall biosynthesis
MRDALCTNEQGSEAMSQKQFSVIIPTYNCGRKLEATIASVLSQSKGLYELIVVDGNSTDETLEIVRKYAGHLRFISEDDRGVYDAINKGVRMSSGKYIFIIGAGDRLRDGVLERVVELLPEEPSLVYGNAFLVRYDLNVGWAFDRTDFIKENICQQAIFFERTIFEVLGGFDLKYKVYADWAFNMKCFADPRVRKIYLDMVVADFEGWGISDTQEDIQFKQDFPRMIREYVGMSEYLCYRVYLTRVSFYFFRHRLADFLKAVATLRVSRLRRQKP